MHCKRWSESFVSVDLQLSLLTPSCRQASSLNIPQQVNLVVLGPTGVGKSTFVQRALDLKQLPLSPTSAKKMSLDGVIYLVKLIEVDLDEVHVVHNARIAWPDGIDGEPIPPVNGVLSLVDVSDSESLSDFPKVLSKRGLFLRIVSLSMANILVYSGAVKSAPQALVFRSCRSMPIWRSLVLISSQQKHCSTLA